MTQQDTPESKHSLRRLVIKFICVVIGCIVAHVLLDALVARETLEEMRWIEGVGTGTGIGVGIVVGDYLAARR